VLQALAKDQVSEVLVRRQQDRVCLSIETEHGLIVNFRIQFCHVQHLISVHAEQFDDLPIDTLVPRRSSLRGCHRCWIHNIGSKSLGRKRDGSLNGFAREPRMLGQYLVDCFT
jgi:hypothetical protein